MSITASSKWAFLVTGIYALACAPAILLAERFGWRESVFHQSQFIAVLLCLPASAVFLWSTRGSRFGVHRWLAVVATVLCGLWLALIAYLILTLDFSGID